jgi:hypothetical protein
MKFGNFVMHIQYIGRASFRDQPLKFLKCLCRVVIELFNFKDPMWLLQKTYLCPVQIVMQLVNTSKIYGYMDIWIYGYSTLPDYW